MLMDEQALFETLQGRRHSLLRVELQPAYDVASDGDDFRRYREGAERADDDLTAGWPGQLGRDSTAGRPWRKVHVIGRRSITDYERFMFDWYFTRNCAAGEQIRILEVPGSDAVAQPMPDWYALDGERVVLCHYRNGTFVGAEEAPGDVRPWIMMAETFWALASPFALWWTAHPELHRDGVGSA